MADLVGKFQHHGSLAELSHSFKESNRQTLEEHRVANLSSIEKKVRAAHEARMKAKQENKLLTNGLEKDTIEVEKRRAEKLAALDSLIEFNHHKFNAPQEIVIESMTPRAHQDRQSNLSALEIKVLAAHEKRIKEREIKRSVIASTKLNKGCDKDTPRTEARRQNKLQNLDQLVMNDPTFVQHQAKLVALTSMIDFAQTHLQDKKSNGLKENLIANENETGAEDDNDDNNSVDTIESDDENENEVQDISPEKFKTLVDFVVLAHEHVLKGGSDIDGDDDDDETAKQVKLEKQQGELAALDDMVEFAKSHLS